MVRSFLVVACGLAACSSSTSSIAGRNGAAPRNQDPLAALVAGYHAAGQFDGVVLVAERGRIVYQGAVGLANREWEVPHTLESRFEIASMTKPMTAMVILQLVDEGKLRLDAPAADYLPQLRTGELAAITIDHLLTHRSGLQQDIAFPDNAREVPPIVAKINADLVPLDELVRLIVERPLRFPPGTRYAYSSDGYAVLGAVIERVTGRSFDAALAERVFGRAGMTAASPALLAPIVPRRAIGYRETFDAIENAPHIGATPAGGLYATAADLYAWERAIAGGRLMSPATIARVFALRPAEVITAYGWKTREEERRGSRQLIARTTGGLPGFVNVLERIPAEDRVVIALSNVRGPVYAHDRLIADIHAVLDGRPHEPPRRSAAVFAARDRADVAAALDRLARDPAYYVDEAEVNALGYHLIGRRATPAAIAVFALNVARFPRSANAHDSLGEAHMTAGDRAAAIRSYEQVLVLDPGNANATKMLERLRRASP